MQTTLLPEQPSYSPDTTIPRKEGAQINPACCMTRDTTLCAGLSSLSLEKILTLKLRKVTPHPSKRANALIRQQLCPGLLPSQVKFYRIQTLKPAACTRKTRQGHWRRRGRCLEIAREHDTMHSSSNMAQNVQSLYCTQLQFIKRNYPITSGYKQRQTSGTPEFFKFPLKTM